LDDFFRRVGHLAVKQSSAAKRHRQSEERRLRNKNVKSAIRTVARKVAAAAQKKDGAAADESLADLIKKLDTAARKGIIKKNTAARKKSRLQRLCNGLKA
jgi:small subunit ribosomal protein S20